jgi:hypothetical protein
MRFGAFIQIDTLWLGLRTGGGGFYRRLCICPEKARYSYPKGETQPRFERPIYVHK